MRVLLAVLFLLLSPCTGSAQILAISNDKMNVCYIGVNNPLSVAYSGCPGDKLLLRTDNGHLSYHGNGHFIFNPRTPGTAQLTASCASGQDTVVVGVWSFRIRELPAPRPSVAGKYGGPIGKDLLLAQAGMEAGLEAFDFDARFTVTSFEWRVKPADGSATTVLKSDSASFTAEMKSAMQSLTTGDRIFLDEIRCKGPDGKTKRLSPLMLTIE